MGNRTRAKIVKNKVAPPFKQVEFDIVYGEGISREGSLLDYGVELDLIQKSGAWYSFGEIRLGQGKENARQFLKENTDIAAGIEQKIRETYDLPLFTPPGTGKETEKNEQLFGKRAGSCLPSFKP